MAKIVIAGGTGALGKLLAAFYVIKGWEVVVLTRSVRPAAAGIRYVTWDGRTLGAWADELAGAAAVVNLAGRTINTRFTESHRREILDSRIESTAIIGEAIGISKHPPAVWVNAGGISIFESSAEPKTEADIPNGTDFLSVVSQRWESVFSASTTPDTRKVQYRISSVLLSKGGMLSPLVQLVRLGIGGTIGSGSQYISWIHERDFVKLVDWSISNEHVHGVIHACSPHPVTNQFFMQALRKRMGVSLGFPNPAWSITLGAWLVGTQPELVLSGNRVLSSRVHDQGFAFDFPELTDALHDLML